MSKTRFEAWREYKTRDGRRAFLCQTGYSSNYPLRGYVEGFGEETWTSNGRVRMDGLDRSLDLILPDDLKGPQDHTFEITVSIPYGYRATGEYREARDGEYWLVSDGRASAGRTIGKYIILEKE